MSSRVKSTSCSRVIYLNYRDLSWWSSSAGDVNTATMQQRTSIQNVSSSIYRRRSVGPQVGGRRRAPAAAAAAADTGRRGTDRPSKTIRPPCDIPKCTQAATISDRTRCHDFKHRAAAAVDRERRGGGSGPAAGWHADGLR